MPRAAIVRGLSVLVVSTSCFSRSRSVSTRRRLPGLPVRDAILDGAADDPAAGDPAGDAADHDVGSRRPAGATARGAATLIATGVVLTYLTAGWLTPLMRRRLPRRALRRDRSTHRRQRTGRPCVLSMDGGRQARRPLPKNAPPARDAGGIVRNISRRRPAETRPRWGWHDPDSGVGDAMGALGWGNWRIGPVGADARRERGGRSRGSRCYPGRTLSLSGERVSPYIGRPPVLDAAGGVRDRGDSRSRSLLGAGGSGELNVRPTTYFSSAHAVNVVPDGTSRCWRPSIM